MRVLRYELKMRRNVVTMPMVAKVLHVDTRAGGVSLWAMVDDTAATHERTFLIFGTGDEVETPERLRYVGSTIVRMGEELVWHVFELLPAVPS